MSNKTTGAGERIEYCPNTSYGENVLLSKIRSTQKINNFLVSRKASPCDLFHGTFRPNLGKLQNTPYDTRYQVTFENTQTEDLKITNSDLYELLKSYKTTATLTLQDLVDPDRWSVDYNDPGLENLLENYKINFPLLTKLALQGTPPPSRNLTLCLLRSVELI